MRRRLILLTELCCPSQGHQQAGEMCQQEHHHVRQQEMQNPSPGRNHPMHKLESSFVTKDLRLLADTRLNMNHVPFAEQPPKLGYEKHCQQVGGGGPSLCT